MSDTDNEAEVAETPEAKPSQSLKRKKATKKAILGMAARTPRVMEYMVDEEVGWVALVSINDREYTKIQNSVLNSKGKFDKVQGAFFNQRLIVEMTRDLDDHSVKLFTEADIKAMRDLDAGMVDRWATACREHLGVATEDDLKNSSTTQES